MLILSLEGHFAPVSACMKLFKEWNLLDTSSPRLHNTIIKRCTIRIQTWRHSKTATIASSI